MPFGINCEKCEYSLRLTSVLCTLWFTCTAHSQHGYVWDVGVRCACAFIEFNVPYRMWFRPECVSPCLLYLVFCGATHPIPYVCHVYINLLIMSANLNTFNGILWIAANPILFSRLASCRFGFGQSACWEQVLLLMKHIVGYTLCLRLCMPKKKKQAVI